MFHQMVRSLALGVALALALPVAAGAQAPLPDLTLEELMALDAGQVYGASERLQPVTEAPASVSFVTADEIARFGYRTLADILRGVRGMHVSDDRNFSLLGVRGFGKPGDYNSRILLLVNGHRVNDTVFGQAEIGAEFGMDPATFERVEIIRGPASSIYGDSAFFAVVNVITKKGASIGGGTVALEAGSLGTQMARASVGHAFGTGVDVAMSATFEQSDGVGRLYFPAFDTPETNNGVAENLDGERVHQFYGQLTYKSLTFTAAYGSRRRTVPTASFNTLFNEQQFPEQTTDRHTLLDAEWVRLYGETRLSIRGSFDRFTYDGTYPFAGEGTGPARVLVGVNSVNGVRWTGGVRVTRPIGTRQTMIAGLEYIDNVNQDQESRYIDPPFVLLDLDRRAQQTALYLQDEIKLASWLIGTVGLRYDGYEQFTRVTPRTALIAMPSTGQSFKYLFGSAFRAPNAYELNAVYFGDGVNDLRPESIDTHELVWERYTGDWLRTSVSGYWYRANRLITLAEDPTTFFGTTYLNQGQVRARGLEIEAQMRLPRGWQASSSYALQQAVSRETGTDLPNSPRHMLKSRLSIPAWGPQSFLALEAIYLGERRTIADLPVPGAATVHLTLTQPLTKSLALVGTVRNLFDVDYSDPASSAHLQDVIPQNGRTARIGLRWTLGAR
ncbi:TonB-dependent receptor [Luteitalea sp.]|uniref:TonB-dependent receptor plug domain-containing protein n=1 Tax=Luteitalea sp. TaxID=2004800 RepID=UPI0025C1918F|nr:TonB-dependent receptor [Luteitalea sp.]